VERVKQLFDAYGATRAIRKTRLIVSLRNGGISRFLEDSEFTNFGTTVPIRTRLATRRKVVVGAIGASRRTKRTDGTDAARARFAPIDPRLKFDHISRRQWECGIADARGVYFGMT
jgi:hypothetical protein